MNQEFLYTTRSGRICQIEVFGGELEDLGLKADLLVCSAFRNNYRPSASSLIGTIQRAYGISVEELAAAPAIDMKDLGIWISAPIEAAPFHRIACLEMEGQETRLSSYFETVFFALFKANRLGYGIETIAMPLIGTGNQAMKSEDILIPLIAETLNAFEFVDDLKRILFFERDKEKYRYLCEYLSQELKKNDARSFFISYSHQDASVADKIADILEKNGAKVWIDHKKIRSANYPEEIMKAMESSGGFIILVSGTSQKSVDVGRELSNAGELERTAHLQILPVRLDREEYSYTFRYYLAGHNYYDLSTVTEDAVEEVCRKLCEAPVPAQA